MVGAVLIGVVGLITLIAGGLGVAALIAMVKAPYKG